VQALKLLRAAQTGSYPPNSKPPKPLEFNLDVVEETPPTADQISTILDYTKKTFSSLLSTHPSAAGMDRPSSPKELHSLVQSNPKALRWPIVVNCALLQQYEAMILTDEYSLGDDGQAAIGDVEGVKGILESLRKKRDGEDGSGSSEGKSKGWFS